jgi:predicted phosphodiesterase
MKIALCSDLHLEFDTIKLDNTEGAHVLILSGDILVEKDLDVRDRRQTEMGFARARSEKWHEFFDHVCNQFSYVIYIAGNHEHYHGDYATTILGLKRKLNHHSNLHILDKEMLAIQDVIFIGGTLWTDMNKEDPITLLHMKGMMNDFRCVQNSNRVTTFKDEDGKFHERKSRFTPEDAVEDHKEMLAYIRMMIEGKWDQKFAVVGHHAPSKLSTHPRYKEEVVMNGGYSSALDEFIMDHPQIKVWTHGHTHEDFDYKIGSTRIVCNPRGYAGHEDRADRFELKYFEV